MVENRSKTIIRCGWLFILTNVILAVINVVVGLLANSLAIVSDALHSLIDAISGVLVIVTEKIATMKRFANSRNKIERITTVIIAIIIIIVGIHIIIESVEKIIEPEEVEYSFATILILIISVILKYALAFYLRKTGKTIRSKVVEASGAETMNDCFISVAVLISAIIYLIWQIDIEAYVSIAISFVIIKIGLEFIFPHLLHHHHHHLDQNHDHGLKA